MGLMNERGSSPVSFRRTHIDGLSIEFKGIGEHGELIAEIYGQLNSSQLRLLADAIDQR